MVPRAAPSSAGKPLAKAGQAPTVAKAKFPASAPTVAKAQPKARAAREVTKTDPADGQEYTLDALKQKYADSYSEEEVLSYWNVDMFCKPVTEEEQWEEEHEPDWKKKVSASGRGGRSDPVAAGAALAQR